MDARDLALAALRGMDRSTFARESLDAELRTAGDVSSPDAALANEIVLGVVRNRVHIQRLIRQQLSHPRPIAPELVSVLQIALYQLIWLDRVPDYAAVDSAVRQAKRLAGKGAGGLVNAVLRAVQRRIDQPRALLTDRPTFTTGRHLPIDRQTACVLRDNVVTGSPTDVLAVVCSHPRFVVAEWVERVGIAGAELACLHGLARPQLSLRPLAGTAAELAATLQLLGVPAWPHPDGHVIHTDSRILSDPLWLAEHAQPQDATSAAVVAELPLEPGQTVIDLCAAPGTKTQQLAARVGQAGHVFASDQADMKLNQLRSNLRDRGLTNVTVLPPQGLPSAGGELPRLARSSGGADLVLLDVPCSNSGVFARRPEAKLRLTAQAVATLAQTQSALLDAAATLVRPGGFIAYSTCSVLRHENQAQIDQFRARHPAWQVRHTRETWMRDQPADATSPLRLWNDGGFLCVLHHQPGPTHPAQPPQSFASH